MSRLGWGCCALLLAMFLLPEAIIGRFKTGHRWALCSGQGV